MAIASRMNEVTLQREHQPGKRFPVRINPPFMVQSMSGARSLSAPVMAFAMASIACSTWCSGSEAVCLVEHTIHGLNLAGRVVFCNSHSLPREISHMLRTSIQNAGLYANLDKLTRLETPGVVKSEFAHIMRGCYRH